MLCKITITLCLKCITMAIRWNGTMAVSFQEILCMHEHISCTRNAWHGDIKMNLSNTFLYVKISILINDFCFDSLFFFTVKRWLGMLYIPMYCLITFLLSSKNCISFYDLEELGNMSCLYSFPLVRIIICIYITFK